MEDSHTNIIDFFTKRFTSVHELSKPESGNTPLMKNEKIKSANCNVQFIVLKKLNGAKQNIDRSQLIIKDLNHKDTDYKVLNNHLKMSLILLERARSALRDALVDINLNRLKSQESTCHN